MTNQIARRNLARYWHHVNSMEAEFEYCKFCEALLESCRWVKMMTKSGHLVIFRGVSRGIKKIVTNPCVLLV
jgi:hypothetical protein